jgi:hypothetical protein
MNRNIFEDIAESYYKVQEQLTDNDPHDEFKDNYESLKSFGEVS